MKRPRYWNLTMPGKEQPMYHLIRNLGFREAVGREAPGLVVSLGVAESFFKFHSFVLECVAFLAVWYCVSWAANRVREAAGSK